MRNPTYLVPVEFQELLRQAKTNGEVAFVCRVLLRKRLAREDTLKTICSIYGLNFEDWKNKGFCDSGRESTLSKPALENSYGTAPQATSNPAVRSGVSPAKTPEHKVQSAGSSGERGKGRGV